MGICICTRKANWLSPTRDEQHIERVGIKICQSCCFYLHRPPALPPSRPPTLPLKFPKNYFQGGRLFPHWTAISGGWGGGGVGLGDLTEALNTD